MSAGLPWLGPEAALSTGACRVWLPGLADCSASAAPGQCGAVAVQRGGAASAVQPVKHSGLPLPLLVMHSMHRVSPNAARHPLASSVADVHHAPAADLRPARPARRWAAYYLAHDTQGPTKGVWWEHVVPHHALAPLDLAPASISLPVAADAGSGGGWQQHVLGPEQLLPVRCEQLKLAYRLTLLTDPTQEMLQACAGLWGAGSSLGQAGKHGGGSSSGSRAWWHWGRHKPQQKASGQGSAAPGDTAQQAAPGSPQLQDGDDDSVDADLYSSTDLAAGGAATAPAVPSEPADAVPEELAVSRKLVPLVKDWASRAAGSGSGDDPLEASGSSAEQEGLSQQLVPKDVGLEVDGVLYSPAYLEQYVTGPDGAVVPSDAAIPALRLSADVPSAGLQMIWRGLQELAWVSEHREQYPVLVNGP